MPKSKAFDTIALNNPLEFPSMRVLPTLAVLGLILVGGSAWGADNKPHVYGSTSCPKIIPCYQDSAASAVSSRDWVEYGNSCMESIANRRIQDGFFEDYAGLDVNGCLTTRSDLQAEDGSRLTLKPICCVVRIPDGTCHMRCSTVDNN